MLIKIVKSIPSDFSCTCFEFVVIFVSQGVGLSASKLWRLIYYYNDDAKPCIIWDYVKEMVGIILGYPKVTVVIVAIDCLNEHILMDF